MNYFNFGENRLTELKEIFKCPATTLDSTQRTILLSEIERALSGVWTAKQPSVEEFDYETVLPESDRKTLVDIIKSFAPMRRTKQHNLTDSAAPTYELLFEHLKAFGTDQGANSLIDQLLSAHKQRHFESTHLKARRTYIRAELHIFYSCARLLLPEEKVSKHQHTEPPSSNLENLFQKQREEFFTRSELFFKYKDSFCSAQASKQWYKVTTSLQHLSDITALHGQFKSKILSLRYKISQNTFTQCPLVLSSLVKGFYSIPQLKSLSNKERKATSFWEQLRAKGYINDLGMLQPAYDAAKTSNVNIAEGISALEKHSGDLIRIIDSATTNRCNSISFPDLLSTLSKIFISPSPYKNLYLLVSILLAEKHLLSLFPDCYADTRKNTTCSEKNAYFFIFLYLYFSRKPYEKNLLADTLLWQCLSEVLESESFLTELRAGEQQVKQSLEAACIKAQYKDLLNNPKTIEILAERLRIYSEELIKIDNTSQLVNQPQLAEVLGYTQQQISKILNASKLVISPFLLVNISQRTGLGTMYLLGLSDDPMAKQNGLSTAILKTPTFKVLYLSSRYKNKNLPSEDLRFLKFLRKKYGKRNRFKIKFKEPAQAEETKSK